jgi:hypothetical protein
MMLACNEVVGDMLQSTIDPIPRGFIRRSIRSADDEADEGLLSRVLERLSEIRFGIDLLEAPRTLLRLRRPK